MLVFMRYDKEMQIRKFHNETRILEVESEKAEEAISRLVPRHIMDGIKNDVQIIDALDFITVVYVQVTGVDEFGIPLQVTPEYVRQLSSLFGHFDNLCEIW